MRILPRLVSLILFFGVPVVLVGEVRLPTPESVLGFRPGADYKLATYDQSVDYFKKVAAASKYVKLLEAGKTSQGRTIYYALVSSPDNLGKVDRYREIARRLAHPQGLTDAAARKLAHDGKAFVHIDGGLHATEVAGPQHTPQLLYDLVSKVHEPDTKAILDNVIVMLWPTINPDGQQMVAEWYMKNAGTPYELSGLPRLYQDYVGHDNNRDAYMLNMIESRVLEHTWRQWEPQIIYVHHQSGPFPTRIWLPPFSEPVGFDAPFIMSREVNMIGMAIAKSLEEHGQVGATHMGTAFDAWYPGYVDYAPNFKNIAAFWTETALFQYATPHDYTITDFPPNMRDLRPQSLYLEPVAPGPMAASRRGRLHGNRVAVGARVRVQVQELAALRSLPGGPRSDSPGLEESALRILHPPTAARSRRSRRDAPPNRLWRRPSMDAHRSRDDRSRHVPVRDVGHSDGPGICRDGPRSPGHSDLSRPSAVSRRAAGAAVRRGRVVAAAADGRAHRAGALPSRHRGSGQDEKRWRTARAESETHGL